MKSCKSLPISEQGVAGWIYTCHTVCISRQTVTATDKASHNKSRLQQL